MVRKRKKSRAAQEVGPTGKLAALANDAVKLAKTAARNEPEFLRRPTAAKGWLD